MRAQQVTLRDISRATGFTINSVSRALKNKKDISPATRELIQKQARKMGYIPNALAVSLRLGRTRTISVIIPDITDPLFAILIRDLESKLRLQDYDLFIQNTDEDDKLEKRAILAAIGKKIDGFIICPCQKDPSNIRLIRDSGIPFVLLGRRFGVRQYSYVVADDRRGGFLATKHLIDRGHRDILFLNGPRYISSAKERLQGYKKALQENGLCFNSSLVFEVAIKAGECSKSLTEQFRNKPKFSSIFCFSDLMAWEAMSFLHSRNIRIPEDIAVVGFDDIQSRLFCPIPLTSIGYGKRAIAEAVADILMSDILGTPGMALRRKVADVELVVRAST